MSVLRCAISMQGVQAAAGVVYAQTPSRHHHHPSNPHSGERQSCSLHPLGLLPLQMLLKLMFLLQACFASCAYHLPSSWTQLLKCQRLTLTMATGSFPNGKIAGYDYNAVSSIAKSAAKAGGKQLRTFGEAGYKYLSSQYDTWRGSRGDEEGAEHAG